jgi:predicted amidophosphoribosyltransferase
MVNTDTQTAKGRMDRWKNTEGIFRIKDATTLTGKHILLVDDVATTGATLHACTSALLTVPGVRVSVFALTKAM